ncbi:MAG: Ectoine hydrolase [Gammaproteobacteria bacterium]|nr:Ectoine hydrolase [Gammaproteobacteria bacterium]
MATTQLNGTPYTPFPEDEYRQRVARTREKMLEQGIDVLLACDPASINYLSGYDGYSFYVHQSIMLIQEVEWPLWVGRAQDLNGARFTSVLPEANLIGYPDEFVQSTEQHPMEFICTLLRERGLHKASIGVDADNYYFSGKSLGILRAQTEGKVVDVGLLLNRVRTVKSLREIAYIEQAAQISDLTMQQAIDMVEPGVRQCDVAAEILKTQVAGTAEFGGDYPAIMPLMPSGPTATCPHVTWRDIPFQAETVSVVEISGVRHHYHAPLTRTLYLGTPPSEIRRTADVVVEGIDRALSSAAPGALARDVHAAWNTVINRHGIYKESRCGYSIGLGYPPDWGEHTVSLRAGDETVLEPNMTIHFMPGIWMEDWGISISETIRITEEGSVALCGFPRQLLSK